MRHVLRLFFLCLFCLFFLFIGVAPADHADVGAQLEARGVKLKKLKDGTVVEASVGGEVPMTLDDYRLIGKLTKLQRVNLSARDLPLRDDTLAEVGALPNVEHFFSNGSKFTDDGLKGFAGWKNLRHLGFDHWFGPEGTKDFVGAGLAHLAVLPKLESVRLGGCRVDNRVTAALAKIKTLQRIDLFHTFAVTDDGMPALQALPDLRVIKLGPQYTPRITDATLRHLSAIPTLEEIHITETWLTYDGGFIHLKKLPRLQLVSIPSVVANPADIERLKLALPNAKVVWNPPDEENAARTRKAFERAGIKQGAKTDALPPVRAITRSPKYHWFGYYDHLQFDPTGRYVLGMEVDFEHRSPGPDDVVKVGMVDLQDGDRWIELGESRAWNWQQGCMLQWLPGSQTEVVWNDRRGDQFVSHILDVKVLSRRTLPVPVYAISPDGRWAIYPDFRRLHHARPGYGYAGLPDPHRGERAPEDVGLWRLDLRTGQTRLLLSLADGARLPAGGDESGAAMHWYNHLLFAPDGRRFAFLHRWRGPAQGQGFATRLVTADLDGKNLFVLDPHGKTSHFIWRDPHNILAWSWHPSSGDGFYLYTDRTREVEPVGRGVMTENGHCTYLPGGRWILNDTYPDRERLQHPYLFDTRTGQRYPLGHFRSPPAYAGEWRCDTHPRFSPDGRQVVIDSPHGGDGRQMYLIDVSGIVRK